MKVFLISIFQQGLQNIFRHLRNYACNNRKKFVTHINNALNRTILIVDNMPGYAHTQLLSFPYSIC